MISRFFITCLVLCFSTIYTLKAQQLVADFPFDNPANLLNNMVDGQPDGLFVENPTVGVCTNPETNQEGLCSSVKGDNFSLGIPTNLFTGIESITLEFDFFCQEEYARLINASGATEGSEQPTQEAFRIGYGAEQGFRIVYYTEADPTTPITSGFTDISITPGERARLTFTYDKETGVAQFYKDNILVWETPDDPDQRTPGFAFLLGPTNKTADGTEYVLIGEGMDGEASDIPSLYSFRMYDQACPAIDPPAVNSPVEICSSEKATLEAPALADGDEYYWYDQNNTLVQQGVSNTFETPVLNETTTYSIEILRGPCRSAPAKILVTVNPTPNAPSVTEPTFACEPSIFTLEANGGTDGNYQWYQDDDGVPELIPDFNQAIYTTDILPSGVTIFYVSVTENGCPSDLTEVSAIVRIPPEAPTADPVILCQPGEVTLQVNDADEFTYRWYDQPTDGTLLAENNGSFNTTVNAATTFYISAQSGGCESERVPLEVNLAERPEAPQSEDQTVCEAGPVTLTATGGTDGNYRWYEGDNPTPIVGAVNSTFSPTVAQTTTYYVVVDDGICQSDPTSVTVTILSEAAPPRVDGPQNCTPTAFELVVNNAVAGSTYRWYADDGTTVLSEGPARYTTDVLTEPTYYYVVQVVDNCESERTLVQATVYPPLPPPTANPVLLCEPGEVVLRVDQPGELQYRWYSSEDNETLIGNSNLLATNDGEFPTTITDNTTLYVSAWNGTCESERTSVSVGILESPDIDAGDDTRILPGDRVTLTAPAGFVQYQWSPSEGLDNPNIRQPTAAPTRTTTYYLTVTTDQDCDLTSTVTVAVAERLPIPNAFTPNADGLNDTWDIPFLRRYPQSKVLVYNRWGSLIFQSEPGYEKAWDGFYQGSVVQQGIYTYVLDLGNGQKPTRGHLTILQ